MLNKSIFKVVYIMLYFPCTLNTAVCGSQNILLFHDDLVGGFGDKILSGADEKQSLPCFAIASQVCNRLLF